MLGHHGRRHGEQNAVCVDQADLLPLAHKSDRLPLDHRDANPVREQAHHRGALNPGNLFQLLAPFVERDKEDVAPDIFAEDRQHLRSADLVEAGGLDVACPGDAEAPVAAEVALEKVGRCAQPAQHRHHGQRQKDAPRRARRTPPGVARPVPMRTAKALPAKAASTEAREIVVRVRHLKRHARQRAARWGHTLPHAPEAGFRGRFIFPHGGTVSGNAFDGHA